MIYYVKEFDRNLWDRAQERASKMPIYPGSHRGMAANQVGALGEVVFEHFLFRHEIPFIQRYATTEDLAVLGDTLEVKTKDRTVRPRGDHDCTVPLYNHDHQRPTKFVFVSLLRTRGDNRMQMDRFLKAYLLGWCSLEKMDSGREWGAGDVDESNGTKFWTACKNIYVRDLRPMGEMVEEYRRRMRGSDGL